MPFGLSSGSACFQNLIDKLLTGAKRFATAFLDDIIIHSKGSLLHYLRYLEDVFNRLELEGLKQKLSKCDFLKQHMEYRGHIESIHGIKSNPDKVEVIGRLPVPTCVKEVGSFLGTVGLYRRFIPEFSEKAPYLTQLTRKNAYFKWNLDCQNAFGYLKTQLANSVTLA